MGFRLGHSFNINLLSTYYLGSVDTVASKIDIVQFFHGAYTSGVKGTMGK